MGKDIFNLINYIPGGVCVFNLNSRHSIIEVVAWNDSMIDITEYNFEEVNEDILLQMFNAKEKCIKSVRVFIENQYKFNKKSEEVYEIKTKSGIKKIISIALRISVFEEEQYRVIALVRDVTTEKMKEKELREVEERYNKILQSSTDAILIYGDEKVIFLNNKGLKMLGFKDLEEVKGKNLFDIVHPDFHEIAKNRIKESQEKEGSVQLIEEKYVTSFSEVLDVEIQMTYIPYEGKKCNVAFVRDITERKLMENALRKSEKYFKNLFNNVNDAIYLNKIDENGLPSTYIEVNNVACKRLGYSREQLTNMTPYETNPDITKEKAQALMEQLSKVDNVIYEGLAQKRNGERSPVEINSMILILNDEKYLLSISRDISERKKNAKMLEENEKRYRYLVEALPYGVYIWDKSKLLFSNKVGLEYLGLSSLDELEIKCKKEIIKPHPSYEEAYKKSIDLIYKNGGMPLTEEKFIRCSDNKVLDLETIITKYPYGENNDTYLTVTRDIGDRKKAEALEKDMNEKTKLLKQSFEYERLRTEFFANISHELRTPINVIFSTLQLIEYNLNNCGHYFLNSEKSKKHIGIMKQNCYRLLRLINNLIDVTKIDSGYLETNLINTNIISIVEDITLSVAEYIENKGLELIFDTEIEELIMACDPDKIERIILNLISNAIKFTEQGGTILVNIKRGIKTVIISVKDTGIGISKNKQKIIFQRFVQIDKSLARNHEGSGIGLSLVKSLVKMHKGTITVESEPNKGSEFIIELPIYLVDDKKNKGNTKNYILEENVEKIKIEFSDIYL